MADLTRDQISGFIIDSKTGMLLPEHMLRFAYTSHPLDDPNNRAWDNKKSVVLSRDPDTGIVKTPGYGTGLDDFTMRNIVRGNIGNVGISPVVDPLLSTLVGKRQAMASTWQILVSGKYSPTKALTEIISHANDSEYGASDFVSKYIGSLDVDNRGAIFSKVPIESISLDKWSEYGMELVPIPDKKQTGSKKRTSQRFYLQMTQESLKENYGLWMVDGLTCAPTGNPEWPYWIKKHSDELNGSVWVLIHRDYGGQIIQQVGPVDNDYRGFGQSGTWRYMRILMQDVLIVEMDIEALLNQPPRGVLWGVGLDNATQLKDQLQTFRTERAEAGVLMYPGVLIGGSRNDKANIMVVRWSEPPAGYTPDGWKKEREDVLAACFHVSVAQIVTRLGEGAFTQSRVTDDIQAETGIAWMRNVIELVLNHIAPPRVRVTVNWLSDRAKRYQLESLDILSSSIERIQNSTGGLGLSVNEIRAIIQEHGALPIPNVEKEETTVQIKDDPVKPVESSKSSRQDVNADGEDASSDSGVRSEISTSGLKVGDTIVTTLGNLGTLLEISSAGIATVQHDWHKAMRPPGSTSYHINDIRLFQGSK